MKKPLLLDLFCGAGGAAMGYYYCGFNIIGIDNKFQKNYPPQFKFYKYDAIKFLEEYIVGKYSIKFDAIHASPPCQHYSSLKTMVTKYHGEYIPYLRQLLISSGLPYIIENVEGSPLIFNSCIFLCGTMFNLKTYRHRLFETNFKVDKIYHFPHKYQSIKSTKTLKSDYSGNEFIQIVGHFSNVALARRVMEINWMTRDELSQAIPPKYTEYIGKYLLTSANSI